MKTKEKWTCWASDIRSDSRPVYCSAYARTICALWPPGNVLFPGHFLFCFFPLCCMENINHRFQSGCIYFFNIHMLHMNCRYIFLPHIKLSVERVCVLTVSVLTHADLYQWRFILQRSDDAHLSGCEPDSSLVCPEGNTIEEGAAPPTLLFLPLPLSDKPTRPHFDLWGSQDVAWKLRVWYLLSWISHSN